MKKVLSKIKRVLVFYRKDVPGTSNWRKKISAWLKTNHPEIILLSSDPNNKISPRLVIALGGDGTILEAVRAIFNGILTD